VQPRNLDVGRVPQAQLLAPVRHLDRRPAPRATIVTISGSEALDEESLALVKRDQPLPALPAGMPAFEITVPVRFSIR
jgi:hypothetical protein